MLKVLNWQFYILVGQASELYCVVLYFDIEVENILDLEYYDQFEANVPLKFISDDFFFHL